MGITNYPNGISSFGMPIVPRGMSAVGKTFFVDSVHGSDGNAGRDSRKPLATLAKAITLCTASAGDTIFLLPGHAESTAVTITQSKIGVSIIGIGEGTFRPTLTTTGAVSCITVTGAGTTIENIVFAAPGIDTVTADVDIQAAGCTVRGCTMIGSATSMNKVDFIKLSSAANDCLIEHNNMYNSVVELTGGGINLSGACARVTIQDNLIFDSIGLALGAVYDGATALAVVLRRNVLKNAKAATVVLEFGNNSTGICSFNHISGRHTTLASNITTGTGMDFFENRLTEEAALNGAIAPAADTD